MPTASRRPASGTVYLTNSTRKHRIDERRLRRTARTLMAALGEANSSVAISLVGDRAIRRLNAQYRNKDRATDVLSFSLINGAACPPLAPRAATPRLARGAPVQTERQLGDIVISVDAAQRQAVEYGVPLMREVERLLIHGLLHVLGHDHHLPAERARMVRAERKLARAIKMPWPQGYRSGLD
jgi:probable rRNA maturation factor